MTSDETPREPQEGDRASSTGATGSTGSTGPTETEGAGSPGGAGQRWSGPPGSPQASGGGKNGVSAEQRPQTWSCPPNGGGESRAPGRLPASTWLVTLLGATVHTVALTLVLALALPIATLASMSGGAGLSIAVPVVAPALTVFLFWAFRRMLASARFPRPTSAMVLFTAIVFVAFAGSVGLPLAFGFGESADGILTAGVSAAVLAALVMLVSRGARVRWAAAVSAVVLVVAGVVVWAQGDAQQESMLEEQRQINLGHEYEAAVLDVRGWEPYRSEINDAVHESAEETVDPGESGEGGPGEEGLLSLFTVLYQDGDGGYLRTATWADERTAQDPESVLRGWCDRESAYCEDLEVEGADGPVVAQWDFAGSEGQEGAEGAEGSGEQAAPEDPEELGTPDSVRYEYEPGRVVYLGPWTDEAHLPQGGNPGGGAGAERGAAAAPGHDGFEAEELAEWVTQVRPAQEEDLVDLAERTVEYFRSPEDALTGP